MRCGPFVLAALGAMGLTTAAAAQSFVPGPALLEPRSCHSATLLADGRVLVAGGEVGGRVLSTAEVFDPAANRLAPVGTLKVPRSCHTATLLADGRVLIAGGQVFPVDNGPAMPLDAAEIYDPSTGTFTATASMSSPRFGHAAALLPNGQVLVTGGIRRFGAMGEATVTTVSELYDPATGRFTSVSTTSHAAFGHTVTVLESGRVLVIASYEARVFDPIAGLFSETGRPSRVGAQHAATRLADGRVLLTGGLSMGAGLAVQHSVTGAEPHDPRTGIYAPGGDLMTARNRHTATLLPDGRVLILGGVTIEATRTTDGRLAFATVGVADAEIYDPRTNVFTTAGTMAAARVGHVAVAVPGRIWIVGGAAGPTEFFPYPPAAEPAAPAASAGVPLSVARALPVRR